LRAFASIKHISSDGYLTGANLDRVRISSADKAPALNPDKGSHSCGGVDEQ